MKRPSEWPTDLITLVTRQKRSHCCRFYFTLLIFYSVADPEIQALVNPSAFRVSPNFPAPIRPLNPIKRLGEVLQAPAVRPGRAWPQKLLHFRLFRVLLYHLLLAVKLQNMNHCAVNVVVSFNFVIILCLKCFLRCVENWVRKIFRHLYGGAAFDPSLIILLAILRVS